MPVLMNPNDALQGLTGVAPIPVDSGSGQFQPDWVPPGSKFNDSPTVDQHLRDLNAAMDQRNSDKYSDPYMAIPPEAIQGDSTKSAGRLITPDQLQDRIRRPSNYMPPVYGGGKYAIKTPIAKDPIGQMLMLLKK